MTRHDAHALLRRLLPSMTDDQLLALVHQCERAILARNYPDAEWCPACSHPARHPAATEQDCFFYAWFKIGTAEAESGEVARAGICGCTHPCHSADAAAHDPRPSQPSSEAADGH